MGTVAFVISLISCGTKSTNNGDNNGNGDSQTTSNGVSLSIDGETVTSIEKTVGDSFSIEAKYTSTSTTEESLCTWSWTVSPIDGVEISGETTSILNVEANNAGIYVFTATYNLDGTALDSGSVTVTVSEASIIFSLRIDEDASTLTYNQGDTFYKDNLLVYRDATQNGVILTSFIVTQFDITATIDGVDVTLTDGYELLIAGNYEVTVTYLEYVATTTIVVLEDIAWQFTSTLGDYLSANDYYFYSSFTGTEVAVKDDVLIDYGSDTAYTLSTGDIILPSLSTTDVTAIRKFDIDEYDANDNPTDVSTSDFALGYYTNGSSTYFSYYEDIEDIAYYNGYYLASYEWSDSLALEDDGVSWGSLTYLSSEVYNGEGFLIGRTLMEYFLKMSDSSGVLRNNTLLEGIVVPENDAKTEFSIYIVFSSSTSSIQYITINLSLGYLDDVSTVKDAATSYETTSKYQNELLEEVLDVTDKEKGEYYYCNYYNTSDRTVIDQQYYYVEDQIGFSGTTRGIVVDEPDGTVWDSTVSEYSVSDDTISLTGSYSGLTITDTSFAYVYLGSFPIFDGSDYELLWTEYDVEVEYDNEEATSGPGYEIYTYRALGNGYPYFAAYNIQFHGYSSSASNTNSPGYYGIYTEIEVYKYYENEVGVGDADISYFIITPYINHMGTGASNESTYPGKIWFSNYTFIVYIDDSGASIVEEYLDEKGRTSTSTKTSLESKEDLSSTIVSNDIFL